MKTLCVLVWTEALNAYENALVRMDGATVSQFLTIQNSFSFLFDPG